MPPGHLLVSSAVNCITLERKKIAVAVFQDLRIWMWSAFCHSFNLFKSRGIGERRCLTVHETWEWNCSETTISQRRVRSTQLSNTRTCKLPPSGMENATNKNINFDWAFDGARNYCRRVQLLIMAYPHPHCHQVAASDFMGAKQWCLLRPNTTTFHSPKHTVNNYK